VDVPPVQYARTSDGYRIAFRDMGIGQPLVLLPFPFNNLERMWRQHTNLSLYRPLGNRYRLIHYDSRGQGLSDRDLSPDHSFEDYDLDLEAVVEHLKLDRFVLFAGLLGGHTAIRYAARHNDRVQGIILTAMSLESQIGRIGDFEELAGRSWESALMAFIGGNVRIGDREGDAAQTSYFRDTLTQADFLAMARASRRSGVGKELPEVRCPVLVVTGPMHGPMYEDMREVAAVIPGARLVLLDTGHWMSELYTNDGSQPGIVSAIDDFLEDILSRHMDATTAPSGGASANLSSRETEVLRLLAAGKSNQQIADELVISLNTVRRHVSNIFDKTGVANRAQAGAWARDHGLA